MYTLSIPLPKVVHLFCILLAIFNIKIIQRLLIQNTYTCLHTYSGAFGLHAIFFVLSYEAPLPKLLQLCSIAGSLRQMHCLFLHSKSPASVIICTVEPWRLDRNIHPTLTANMSSQPYRTLCMLNLTLTTIRLRVSSPVILQHL